VILFAVLSWLLLVVTAKAFAFPQDRHFPVRELNPGPPEYESALLTTQSLPLLIRILLLRFCEFWNWSNAHCVVQRNGRSEINWNVELRVAFCMVFAWSHKMNAWWRFSLSAYSTYNTTQTISNNLGGGCLRIRIFVEWGFLCHLSATTVHPAHIKPSSFLKVKSVYNVNSSHILRRS
jgi:hypothetical protein